MWKSSDIQPDAETGLYYYGARYYDPSAALWLGVDPLAEKYPGVSPYVYCHGNPVRLIDPTGMEDEEANSMTLDKMYPNMLNEVVVQGEGSHQQQFDQPYGETVTGEMGQGSQSTSNFHGPSIDASDLPQNFGGEGSKGMQFIYNLVKRVGQLAENMFGGNGNSSVEGNGNIIPNNSLASESKDVETMRLYAVTQGSLNDHGVIKTHNIPGPNGSYVNEGDTIGVIKVVKNPKGEIIRDTMYASPADVRKMFKNNR